MLIPSPTGGYFGGEDPQLDAREAQPRWLNPAIASLVPATSDDPGDSTFSLWRFAGRKRLTHDGSQLHFSAHCAQRMLQVQLSKSLHDDAPFAFLVHADRWIHARIRALTDALTTLNQPNGECMDDTPPRPSRAALVHVRALQVFDAAADGASQRDIAEVLFGAPSVQESWSSDSELRAQVRHLIKRGRHYVNGGYRDLLTAPPTMPGRSAP